MALGCSRIRMGAGMSGTGKMIWNMGRGISRMQSVLKGMSSLRMG